MSQTTTLLDQILSGQNRELQVLAASGLVPLPPEDLIPLQVGLTGSPDPEVSGNVVQSLQNMEPSVQIDQRSNFAPRKPSALSLPRRMDRQGRKNILEEGRDRSHLADGNTRQDLPSPPA